MYIVSLNYYRSIEEVDCHLEGHIAWLKHHFREGSFIASGRKDPRTGGVILVKDMERAQLDAILAEDPFTAVANYEVINVALTSTSAGFEALQGV